jgi:hypothetical protein
MQTLILIVARLTMMATLPALMVKMMILTYLLEWAVAVELSYRVPKGIIASPVACYTCEYQRLHLALFQNVN